MLKEIRKPAIFVVGGAFSLTIGSEIARTITEPTDPHSVTLYLAGPAHAPDLPHAPDHEPSNPLRQSRILVAAMSSVAASSSISSGPWPSS